LATRGEAWMLRIKGGKTSFSKLPLIGRDGQVRREWLLETGDRVCRAVSLDKGCTHLFSLIHSQAFSTFLLARKKSLACRLRTSACFCMHARHHIPTAWDRDWQVGPVTHKNTPTHTTTTTTAHVAYGNIFHRLLQVVLRLSQVLLRQHNVHQSPVSKAD
jgi:hypothetical protein